MSDMCERMLRGDLYLAGDPELVAARRRAADVLQRLNGSSNAEREARRALLVELLGAIGAESTIVSPFFCDYGTQISIGARCFVNAGAVMLDPAAVTIGDDVQIATNVQLLTATHPIDADRTRERLGAGAANQPSAADRGWAAGRSSVRACRLASGRWWGPAAWWCATCPPTWWRWGTRLASSATCSSMARIRLDQLLVDRGLASSRAAAKSMILAGEVELEGGGRTLKPGNPVDPGAALTVRVGHAGRAVRATSWRRAGRFDREVADGQVALDAGASTGGFTDVLLSRGAARVYAVDVGRAQLIDRLRRDPRVVSMERTNLRTLDGCRTDRPRHAGPVLHLAASGAAGRP
jgi:maltose O-acetyltransferase